MLISLSIVYFLLLNVHRLAKKDASFAKSLIDGATRQKREAGADESGTLEETIFFVPFRPFRNDAPLSDG